jgi:hypothetical protein
VDHRHVHRKDRAPANPRPDADRRFKQLAKALDDGKTKPKPLCAFAGVVLQLMKLFEDRAEFGFRDAGAGVPDFNRLPRRRQPSRTLPRLVYFVALAIMLRRICSNRRGSLRTVRLQGTTRSFRPSFKA